MGHTVIEPNANICPGRRFANALQTPDGGALPSSLPRCREAFHRRSECQGAVLRRLGERLPGRHGLHEGHGAVFICATPCRRAYDKASRRLGQTVAEADFRDPGELRTWFGEARAPRLEAKPNTEASTPIEEVPARPRPSYGFCQHGNLWYVTDPEGRRIGDPIKTPEAAQRLARQYAARKVEEPAFSVPLAQIEIDPEPRGRWA